TEDTVVALAVTATATEAGAVGSATTSTSFNVTPGPVATTATLLARNSTTAEIDAANTIALSISETVHNCDDTLGTVTISGVPSGWSLSAGSNQACWVSTEALAAMRFPSTTLSPSTEDTVVALAVTATATEAGAVGSATTSTSF